MKNNIQIFVEMIIPLKLNYSGIQRPCLLLRVVSHSQNIEYFIRRVKYSIFASLVHDERKILVQRVLENGKSFILIQKYYVI